MWKDIHEVWDARSSVRPASLFLQQINGKNDGGELIDQKGGPETEQLCPREFCEGLDVKLP